MSLSGLRKVSEALKSLYHQHPNLGNEWHEENLKRVRTVVHAGSQV